MFQDSQSGQLWLIALAVLVIYLLFEPERAQPLVSEIDRPLPLARELAAH